MTLRLALLATLLAACSPAGSIALPEAHADEPTGGGVAVVELFTSEGCSSCPPADAVLADLARGTPSVYALAFHVDYWDELGWRDPFSSAEYTARQRAYAQSFGASGLYTPQMVVGGIEGFIGSDRGQARASIAKALSRGPAVPLSIRASRAGANTVDVSLASSGAPPDASFAVALVEREETVDVRAGENAGRKLRHTNVVRAFAVTRSTALPVSLRLPASLSPANAEIVAFVQRASRSGEPMAIVGAARAPLPL